MHCTKCSSERILSTTSKSSDCNFFYLNGKEFDGYVPEQFGIGKGDYVKLDLCLDCGQLQGKFPRPTTPLES